VDLESVKIGLYRRLPWALQVRAVRHTTPNFSVGTLALLTVDGTQLLLVRPTYRPGWLPPGGLLRRGETAVHGLQRELHEELGLVVQVAEPHRAFLDVRRQAVTFLSVAVLPSTALPRITTRELKDVRWFDVDDLPPLPSDFSEGLPPEDLAAVRAVGGQSSQAAAPAAVSPARVIGVAPR